MEPDAGLDSGHHHELGAGGGGVRDVDFRWEKVNRNLQ